VPAEEVVRQNSSLELGDVYALIGYYPRSRDKVEEYLEQSSGRGSPRPQREMKIALIPKSFATGC
jgi:hypothetical protein